MLKDDLVAAQVLVSGTLRDVAAAIDRSRLGVALVVDADKRLLGIFTDGDLRRSLLRDATLDSRLESYMRREFTSVSPTAARAEVLELMQARRFLAVPILDKDGVLVGVHHLHDLLGIAPRTNWAVIMAGGRGARLGPLTGDVPKPMLKVAGRPIIERLVLHLVGFGIRRIFIAVNYLGHVIENHFGDGKLFGCTIEYLREHQPLGTCGALSLLPARPSEPFLVVNGDLVTQANIGAMLDAHARDVMITVATRRYLHTVPYGAVDLDGSRVVGFVEKPTLDRLINAGIYIVSPQLLDRVPRDTELGMPALIATCLERHERVEAFEIADDWIDVGQKEQLRQARGE